MIQKDATKGEVASVGSQQSAVEVANGETLQSCILPAEQGHSCIRSSPQKAIQQHYKAACAPSTCAGPACSSKREIERERLHYVHSASLAYEDGSRHTTMFWPSSKLMSTIGAA